MLFWGLEAGQGRGPPGVAVEMAFKAVEKAVDQICDAVRKSAA